MNPEFHPSSVKTNHGLSGGRVSRVEHRGDHYYGGLEEENQVDSGQKSEGFNVVRKDSNR